MPTDTRTNILALSLAACLLLMSAALPVPAQTDREVYRWVDEQGNVIFSDTPPAKDATKFVLKTSPTRPLDKAQTAPPAAEPEPEATDSEQVQTTQQEAAAMQKLRTQNCERARSNLVTLETARRVYDPLPNGERRYLDDDELAARKVQAQADIQRWCDA